MLATLHGIKFLIISPDSTFLRQIKTKLKNEAKAEVFLATNLVQARELAEQEQLHAVLCFFDAFSSSENYQFLEQLHEYCPTALFYFYSKKANYKEAVKSIKKGATDFLQLPLNLEKLTQEISSQLSHRVTKLVNLDQNLKKIQQYILFRSEKMRKGLEILPKIAATDYNVLITGESGTGKEMVARAIHALSAKKEGPFIAINCGAIPESLIESELFGYEKGSFTGAHSSKKGKFELAHNGTLLLDEIGEMPLSLQTRLLRVLEERQVFRIGSEKGIKCNVRVLAATNVDLLQSIKQKLFREDLFYRLNILNITLPALRERKEDVSLLAWHFLQKVLTEINYEPPYPYLSDSSIEFLKQQAWRGNVRELKNLMTKVGVLLPAKVRKIEVSRIKESLIQSAGSSLDDFIDKADNFITPLNLSLEEVKDRYIQKILDLNQGNKTKSAKSLKISLRSLRHRTNTI